MIENIKKILGEIDFVLSKIDQGQVNALMEAILKSEKIVILGAGRMGMGARAFAMRLAQMGRQAFCWGDANVPALGQNDLLIVCSGSGETKTILDIVFIAKKFGAEIALVTGNPSSSIGKISNLIIEIKAPSKVKPVENFISIQPMTTLNEQCLMIFFDALVLKLMVRTGETHNTMWARHSNLE